MVELILPMYFNTLIVMRDSHGVIATLTW